MIVLLNAPRLLYRGRTGSQLNLNASVACAEPLHCLLLNCNILLERRLVARESVALQQPFSKRYCSTETDRPTCADISGIWS